MKSSPRFLGLFMHRIKSPGALLVLSLLPFALPVAEAAVLPASVALGPVKVEPTLSVEAGWVDNLFRSPSSEKSTWQSILAPSVRAWMENGPNQYSLTYELEDFRYASSSEDNATDQRIGLDLKHEFNVRNGLHIDGFYYDGHSQRGTGPSEGTAVLQFDRPVEYTQGDLGATYSLGSGLGRARAEFEVRGGQYEFQNFRDITRAYDRDQSSYRAAAYWTLSPRVELSLEGRQLNMNYEHEFADEASRDSNDRTWLVGVEWAMSARFVGTVQVGGFERDFDDSSRSTTSGARWDARLAWHPRSYSLVQLSTRRFGQETTTVGSFVDTRESSVSWRHDWSARTTTNLRLDVANDDYTDSSREDDRATAQIDLTRSLDRWLELGVGYRFEERDSSLTGYDYRRNEVFLRVDVSL